MPLNHATLDLYFGGSTVKFTVTYSELNHCCVTSEEGQSMSLRGKHEYQDWNSANEWLIPCGHASRMCVRSE